MPPVRVSCLVSRVWEGLQMSKERSGMLVTLEGCQVVSVEGECVTLAVFGLERMEQGLIDMIRRELEVTCGHAALPIGFANDLLDRLVDLQIGYAFAKRVQREVA